MRWDGVSDITHHRLAGADGEIIHQPPGVESGWYLTGVPDPDPETSAFIRRLSEALDALEGGQ